MKKIIAVFLAALVVFSTASVAIAADEPAGDVATTVTTIKEENTTRNWACRRVIAADCRS